MEKEKVIKNLEKEIKEKVDISKIPVQPEFTKGITKVKLVINRDLTPEELAKVRKIVKL